MAMADDLWRECAAWLTRCNVIPPDHKANGPDSEIRVLALTLRDGVLLCNLLNFIDANALDMKDFNRKPQMAQFLCCQNIKLFLDTCKNYFGLKESDLFEPTMLYNLTNFHRVLITLSKLSRRVSQIHPNIPGFNTHLSPSERSNSDEDIYKDLHSTQDVVVRVRKRTLGRIRALKADALPSPIIENGQASVIEPQLQQQQQQETEAKAMAATAVVSEDELQPTVPSSQPPTKAALWLMRNCESVDTDSVGTDENSGERPNNSVDSEGQSVEEGGSVDANDDDSGGSSSMLVDDEAHLGDSATNWEEIYVQEHLATASNPNEEKIYEDLCYVTFSTNLPELTASTSSFEQRDFVIRELIDTETNYLEVLQALKDKFMVPMEKLLSREELKMIYPKIKELAEIHEKFLERLRDAVSINPKFKLSQVFLDFREPFLIYGDYCSNMTIATDTLRDVCKRNVMVEQMVQQCQKEHSSGRVQLRDILSVPMQRILKYHLLLDKLVHETSPTHEDYRGLERAKEAMVDVAQYTNEVKRDSEHLVVIQKVRESIVDLNLPNGNDLKQYGRLLLDGDLNIKAHEDQKTKHRYAFIFEKIMILVKNTKLGDNGQYSFREFHNLADYRVETCFSRRTLGRDARFKFQLLLARKTQQTAFTLYMKTEAERNKWCKALSEAMENLDPPGCRTTDHKFHLTTFDTAIICRHCSKFLKGRIHQGYRCKVCEISVHKGCISSTGRCKQGPISLAPPVCDRQLSEFYWFVGPMSRDTASAKLENRKVGTYLLRVRPQGASSSNETMYALSLKTDEHTIKHMKINQKHEKNNTLYYLSSRRLFKTIIELVSFYERNDLGENFAGLNQSLSWPYREVVATALYDFNPKEPNQLPLRKGCQVLVIGKEGDSKGWWRGKTMDRVGFFPKEYVREYAQPSDEL